MLLAVLARIIKNLGSLISGIGLGKLGQIPKQMGEMTLQPMNKVGVEIGFTAERIAFSYEPLGLDAITKYSSSHASPPKPRQEAALRCSDDLG
jgi:hypothetical protein